MDHKKNERKQIGNKYRDFVLCTHAAEKESFDPEQETDKEGRKCPLYRFQKI